MGKGRFELIWDDIGVAHVFADNHADAYRGMGYAAASERLWQIHMSTAYAQGRAAELLGERFFGQDAIQRACNVSGAHTGLPASDGDWIADAYLDGMNAYVDQLDQPPAEFVRANAEPRHFDRSDIAARYRFTSWFQHKSWTEKIVLGRLMATHGVEYFRNHALHFTDLDATLIDRLGGPLRALPTESLPLAYPEFAHARISGSNNWAITGTRSASGKPILAMDPHQPHTIPNTFFYVHLNVGDWDVFGATFPGVPYFMMGYTRDIAWGLTTGFVDCYDIYVEEVDGNRYRTADGWQPIEERIERIDLKAGATREVSVKRTAHGPLLEHLTNELGLSSHALERYATALHWSLTDVPTSAGALAQLPLATTAKAFGEMLFENDVCPLVNNIICVDRHDGLRRFVASTLPARKGVSGSVPLPGWEPTYDFPRSTSAALCVEVDPVSGYALTANNDTLGDDAPFPIHTFATHSARADRIREILDAKSLHSVEDFKAAQLDLTDLRAQQLVPDLVTVLEKSEAVEARLAVELLASWDCHATVDSAAACLLYPFLDRTWARRFMRTVLGDPLLNTIPAGAPGLNRFDIGHFLQPGSPWLAHQPALEAEVQRTMIGVVNDVTKSLGKDASKWRWGDLHQVQFEHRLVEHEGWEHLHVGPDPIGGSATTLAMALHMGPGPGRSGDEVPCRVFHGPAYRLIVDLADPDHAQFVIAGANGGSRSPHAIDNYSRWLAGEYYTLKLKRDAL